MSRKGKSYLVTVWESITMYDNVVPYIEGIVI